MRFTRVIASALAAGLLLSFAVTVPVRGADTVTLRVGVINVGTDAPFLIAQKKGYLKEEGLGACRILALCL